MPSFWSVRAKRECATTRMRDPRTTPSAPFTSDVRRGLLRARTMNPLANSTSTLLVHSVQLPGRRTDELQNRLCLLNLVREALENTNGRRRRNEESNSLAGEFEVTRDLLVTRGNSALQRASG